ncbi:MAG: hypothetical protein ACKOCM_00565 [Cyanobacteriota bacterium]
MPGSERRQLNVPLDPLLVDSLKKRAAEEGVTLSQLVQLLLRAAMEGWSAAPTLQTRLDDHEQRLSRLESHPLLKTAPPEGTATGEPT